ncbi:MAG TPA: hypothetical protein VHW23_46065, partial [Kofleriaceae bacterium]|nr:hypothetical protein [Kofleriaceae bacterium]
MQKILGAFIVALVLAAASGPVRAQPKAATTSDKGNDKGNDKGAGEKGSKVKVYDFSGDTIEGDLIRPEGTTVDARDFAKHSSLIRIRMNFIPEIIKSAEDL